MMSCCWRGVVIAIAIAPTTTVALRSMLDGTRAEKKEKRRRRFACSPDEDSRSRPIMLCPGVANRVMATHITSQEQVQAQEQEQERETFTSQPVRAASEHS